MAQSDFTKVTSNEEPSHSVSHGSTWIAGATDARRFRSMVAPSRQNRHAQFYAVTNPALNMVNLENDAIDLRVEFERTARCDSAKLSLFMCAPLADMQAQAATPSPHGNDTTFKDKYYGIRLEKQMGENKARIRFNMDSPGWAEPGHHNDYKLSSDGHKQAMRLSMIPYKEGGVDKVKIKTYLSKQGVYDMSDADWDDASKCDMREFTKYKHEIFDKNQDGYDDDFTGGMNDPLQGAGAVIGFGVHDMNHTGQSDPDANSAQIAVAKFEVRVVNDTTSP